MTDSQDHQQDEPWQGKKYDTDTHRQRIIASQPLSTNWFQPRSGQQDPPQDPPSQPPYEPPGEPQDRKPWAARHKVLTGVAAGCGLVLVIGIAAVASSSPSSSLSAVSANKLTVRATGATATPTVKAADATHAVTTAPAMPVQTTLASPSTQPRTTAATHKAAPSTPAQTTATATSSPAVTATPTPSATSASCYPLTSAGECFEPGEFCPRADHGMSGLAGDGEAIACGDVDGWRWAVA